MAEAAPQDEMAAAPAPPREAIDPGALLAATALLLCAFPVVAVGFGQRTGSYSVQTYLFWSDLPLMALGLLRLPDLVRWVRARRLDIVTSFTVLLAALAVAWVAHPSMRGALQLLRLLGVAGAVVSARRAAPAGRRVLAGSLALLVVFEVAIALAQRVRDGPVGLRAVGELRRPFVPIGGAHATQGTLIHPYLLAGLAVVTTATLALVALRAPARVRGCAAVAAVAGVAVGFTYSRTAAVALVGLLAVLALGLRSCATRTATLALVAAVVVGAGASALLASDGWVGRAEEAATGDNLTSGRGELAEQALALIGRNPVLGVGPSRYVFAVEADEFVASKSTRLLQPVHAVPLLVVAEGGVVAGAALLLLAVALVRAAMKGGVAGWALLLCYTPFLLLDHFPITFPQGLVITAVWLSALVLAGSASGGDPAGHPEPEVRPAVGAA